MCSIFGYFGKKVSEGKFKKESKKLINRGPDMTRYIIEEDVKLCFHRLAIMDLSEEGMQPFTSKSRYLLCNGEIYGFDRLVPQLNCTLSSKSDCEIILPMFEKYGLEMFKMIDAEFAMIMYDSDTKEVIAARDPIGIRPLFYGTNGKEIAFSSEAKALTNICKKVMPFPPGHYYYKGQFVCYHDISNVDLYHNDSLEKTTKKIHDLLIEGVKKRMSADAPIGFLLSGGLDSSLICSIASGLTNKKIKTFAVGMDKDAIDLKYALEVSKHIGSEHTEIIITVEDVIAAIPDVVKILETYDITTIRASIGMYLMCKKIHELTDVKVLLTGEISDELFGYKYTDFAPNAIEFQKEAQKRIRELYMYDVLRADRCISANSMESRVPFGDIDFVKYVMSINPEIKLNKYNKGKYLLRKAFEGEYLPNDILYREKAAFSDAVGHSMVDEIKIYADSLYGDDYTERCARYKENTPFTKESLLYREIFENYYKGHSGMIKGFWMPNKNWENCNVDDPSARVLSNYGDSGK